MFFIVELERDIVMYPRMFNSNIKETLQTKLVEKVEGSCSGRYGFIISVIQIKSTGDGHIREGHGYVTFPMKFDALVFRPFKGEVFDAVVTTVNKLGFFADVGPLQVFVSKHAIPPDMRFDPQSNPVSYVSQISDEQPVRVVQNVEVRLRVIGITIDASEIKAIGTIKEDYLGVISGA